MSQTFREYCKRRDHLLGEMAQSRGDPKGIEIHLDDEDQDFINQAVAKGISVVSALRTRYTLLLHDKPGESGPVRFFASGRRPFVTVNIERTHLKHLQNKLRSLGAVKVAEHGFTPLKDMLLPTPLLTTTPPSEDKTLRTSCAAASPSKSTTGAAMPLTVTQCTMNNIQPGQTVQEPKAEVLMRWYSTTDSVKQGEPTFLAIVETGVACALVIWYISSTGYYWIIALICLVGATLLLRTPISTERACELFYDWHTEMNNQWNSYSCKPIWTKAGGSVKYLCLGAMVGNTILVSSLAKFIAIVRTLWTDFRMCIRAIGDNWIKAIWCIDSGTPPEFVPGYREYLQAKPSSTESDCITTLFMRIDWIQFLKDMLCPKVMRKTIPFIVVFILVPISGTLLLNNTEFETRTKAFEDGLSTPWWAVLYTIAFLFSSAWLLIVFYSLGAIIETPLRLVVYFPSIVYRIALKSTSLAFFPFLARVRKASSNEPIAEIFNKVLTHKWDKFLYKLAWLCLLLVLGKIICYSVAVHLADAWNTSPVVQFFIAHKNQPFVRYLHAQIEPYKMPLWQWATFANAVLVIGSYHSIGYLVDNRIPYDESTARTIYRIVTVCNGALSWYSIAANVDLAIKNPFLVWPELGPFWPR